jgi:hypothetical protein
MNQSKFKTIKKKTGQNIKHNITLVHTVLLSKFELMRKLRFQLR